MLLYRSTTNKIEELAADAHPHWMSAVEFVDEYNVVGSEDHYNFVTCRRSVLVPSCANLLPVIPSLCTLFPSSTDISCSSRLIPLGTFFLD